MNRNNNTKKVSYNKTTIPDIPIIDILNPPEEIKQIHNSGLEGQTKKIVKYLWANAVPYASLGISNPYGIYRSEPIFDALSAEYEVLASHSHLFHPSNKYIKYISFRVNSTNIIFELSGKTKSGFNIEAKGINNTLYNRSNTPIELDISEEDVYIAHIRKSTIPTLNSGKSAMTVAVAIAEFFNPTDITIQDAASIECDEDNKFSLSWFRFLTNLKPEFSWYNGFGLELNKKLNDADKMSAAHTLQNLRCGDLKQYYVDLHAYLNDEKFTNLTRHKAIPNAFFYFGGNLNNKLNSSPDYIQGLLTKIIPIYRSFPDETTLIDMLKQKQPCLQIAAVFKCLPLFHNDDSIPFLYVDSERKISGALPGLKEFRMLDEFIAGHRRYKWFRTEKNNNNNANTEDAASANNNSGANNTNNKNNTNTSNRAIASKGTNNQTTKKNKK